MTVYQKTLDVDKDWQGIVAYTNDKHGEIQTQKYMQQLEDCIIAMAKGEGHYRDKILSRYIVRVKHCQKHYIFGLMRDNTPMLVIAIFHERMDLMRRLKDRLNTE